MDCQTWLVKYPTFAEFSTKKISGFILLLTRLNGIIDGFPNQFAGGYFSWHFSNCLIASHHPQHPYDTPHSTPTHTTPTSHRNSTLSIIGRWLKHGVKFPNHYFTADNLIFAFNLRIVMCDTKCCF